MRLSLIFILALTAVQRAEAQEPPGTPTAQAASVAGSLFIERLEVHGARVLTAAELDPVLSGYRGREVSAAELQALLDTLTKVYHDRGYPAAQVLLPDQSVQGGLVVLEVHEGVLVGISRRGKSHLSDGYLRRRVMAHVGQPLRSSDLEASLKRLQRDPNVAKIEGQLTPAARPGEVILALDLKEQPRVFASVGFDNHHSSSAGANEGTASLTLRDLTGWGDVWRGTVLHAKGDTEGSGIFAMPLSAHNAEFDAYYSRASLAVIQEPVAGVDVEEKVRAYGFLFSVPALDRLEHRVALFMGAGSEHNLTTVLAGDGTVTSNATDESTATVLFGGIDWTWRGAASIGQFKLTYRRGIDWLGATRRDARNDDALFNPAGADGLFGLEQAQILFLQRLNAYAWFAKLNDRAQLTLRAGAQVAQNPLLLLEKYSVGGAETVRGVPENLLLRDDGLNATVELQMPVPGWRPEPNYRDLVGALFLDYGRSWDHANTARGNGSLDTTDPVYIVTAGIGLLYAPLKGLDAKLYWGRRIADNLDSAGDPLQYAPRDLQRRGLHFAVTYNVAF